MSVLVSVICNTYNQGTYIKQALDSFIMQKTNFEFEVIVHDDASNDETTQIVMEYSLRYPNIIRPIIEKTNQYSKDISITLAIDLPQAKGKYFAFCEGDDFWIDPLKLQKQFDYMESHQDCTLCIHRGLKVNKEGKNIGTIGKFNQSGIIAFENVVSSGGDFCATNSIFAPMRLVNHVPKYLQNYTIDYFWQIYLASQGYVYAFNDVMSAYRVNSNGSWTRKTKEDAHFYIQHLNKMLNSFELFDVETDYIYHSLIDERILANRYTYAIVSRRFGMLDKEPLKTYVKKLNGKKRIKLIIKRYFHFTYKILSHLQSLLS